MASLVLILLMVGLAVAAAAAVASHLACSVGLGLLARVPEERRANLLLAWALLPLLAGLAAVTVVVAPSLLAGVGLAADHCLIHGTHHGHLCLLHPGATPPIPGAGTLLGLAAASLIVAGGRKVRVVARANRQWQDLRVVAGEADQGGIRVLETEQPVAATAGLLRPTVFLSRGLWDRLFPQHFRAVAAHEAAHRSRRDPLKLALGRLAGVLHLPGTARILCRELELAVERAADEAAAAAVGDRVAVAEALVAVARLRAVPASGAAFAEEPLEARVRALVAEAPASRRPWRGAGAALAGLALALPAFAPQFHHGLETLLGLV